MVTKDPNPKGGSEGERPGDNPFVSLQREINRVFEDTWRRFESFPLSGRGSPKVDVAESDESIEVTIELPGMDENDVDVSLSGDMPTVKGERKNEREERRKDYHLSERTRGSFMRTIPLPATVQADKAEAVFRRGVLTVTLPKTPEEREKVRKIPVKPSQA